jgi:DNA-binding transcriptional regulator YiaG
MIKEIRTHYGIPQELFAVYLGISRSHLSMAESGKRQLSTTITL